MPIHSLYIAVVQSYNFFNWYGSVSKLFGFKYLLPKIQKYITRDHRDKLYKPLAKTTLRLNSLSNRVINQWNNLPNNVVNSHDLDEFKNEYDKVSRPNKFIVNSM